MPRVSPEFSNGSSRFAAAAAWWLVATGVFTVCCAGGSSGAVKQSDRPAAFATEKPEPAGAVLRKFLDALARLDCNELASFAPATVPVANRNALAGGCTKRAPQLARLSSLLAEADPSRLKVKGARAVLPLQGGAIYLIRLNGRWFVDDIDLPGWAGGE